jgi:hypothetical protein
MRNSHVNVMQMLMTKKFKQACLSAGVGSSIRCCLLLVGMLSYASAAGCTNLCIAPSVCQATRSSDDQDADGQPRQAFPLKVAICPLAD